jgi:hypothetical protein
VVTQVLHRQPRWAKLGQLGRAGQPARLPARRAPPADRPAVAALPIELMKAIELPAIAACDRRRKASSSLMGLTHSALRHSAGRLATPVSAR